MNKQKTLFGIPIVETEDMSEPVLILGDWSCWKAHRVIDGSGDVLTSGMIQAPSLTLAEIQHIQEQWSKLHRGFRDAHTK